MKAPLRRYYFALVAHGKNLDRHTDCEEVCNCLACANERQRSSIQDMFGSDRNAMDTLGESTEAFMEARMYSGNPAGGEVQTCNAEGECLSRVRIVDSNSQRNVSLITCLLLALHRDRRHAGTCYGVADNAKVFSTGTGSIQCARGTHQGTSARRCDWRLHLPKRA